MMAAKRFLQSCLSKPNRISLCSMCLLSALVVIFLTPILARNVPNAILLGLMALLLLSLLPLLGETKKGDRITVGILALYMCVITAYKLLGVSSAALYYYFNTVQFYFFFAAGFLMIPHLNRRQNKILLAVACAAMAFTTLHNVVLYCIHGAKEYITLFQTAKYTSNSINTPYVSAIMLASGLALLWGLQKDLRWRSRIGAFAICLAGLAFIAVVAQRMIVLVLAILMVALLCLAMYDPKRLKTIPRKKLYFWGAAVLAAIVLLVIFCVPLLRLVRDAISSPRLVKRINQIIRFLKTGDIMEAGGSLTARYELIATSWKTFTSSVGNFLLGVGDHRTTNAVIGNHSYLVDELARYGIIFACVSYLLLYRSLCTVFQNSQVKRGTALCRQVLVLLVIVVLRAAVGAIFDASISIALFLMVPLACRLLSNQKPGQYLSKK